ncbi:MAG: AraC family transcriptional regulator [Burkholderiales bacterium]|nr:AraC family transcriptional regulator [Burkholderiales bacterium]
MTVLSEAGIDAGALGHLDGRIPYADATRLLHACVRHTGRAHFGLLAGQRWGLAHLGALGESMRAASSVRAALELFAAHQHRNSDAAAAFLLEYRDTISLGYAVYREDIEHIDLAYDLAMAFAVNLLRELCGPRWNATECVFSRAVPKDSAPYRRAFRAPLRFNQDHCAVRFPMRWLDHHIVRAPLRRASDLSGGPGASDEPDLVTRTHRLVRVLLLEGKSSGDDLAAKLDLHRRTLNRRLKDEGTTFRRLLDEVRYEVARQLLQYTDMPIPDIAGSLCYSEVSAFMHAFHRWSGTSPHRWRTGARAN